MDFKSPSFRLGLPFGLLILIGFLDFGKFSTYAMALGLLGLSLILVFRQPIHWHFYSRNPPIIEPKMVEILMQKVPFFARLSKENKLIFLKRLSLFLMAKEIEATKEEEHVPIDVKGLIAATGVQLTFGLEPFLFPSFKRIFIHPSAFLSAEIKQPHGSETYLDPKQKNHSCLIFAADRLMFAFDDPKEGYNIAVHEWANALILEYFGEKMNDLIVPNEEFWAKMQLIRGAHYRQLLQFTANPTLSPFGVAVEHFFFQPQRFQIVLPELYEKLCQILNQNPLNTQNPILKSIDYEVLIERSKIF
jgi:Mlc titration factor MtfA (ptsG expression regulator)